MIRENYIHPNKIHGAAETRSKFILTQGQRCSACAHPQLVARKRRSEISRLQPPPPATRLATDAYTPCPRLSEEVHGVHKTRSMLPSYVIQSIQPSKARSTMQQKVPIDCLRYHRHNALAHVYCSYKRIRWRSSEA